MLLVFGSGQIVFGQSDKWSISPGCGYEYLELDFSNNLHIGNVPNFNYESVTGSTYGIGLRYFTNNKIILRSGVFYSQKGYDKVYSFIAIDPMDPFIPDLVESRIQYLEIPLLVEYKVVQTNNYGFFPSVGVVNSIKLSEDEKTYYSDGSMDETKELVDETSSYLAGFRIGIHNKIKFKEKLSVSLEPYLTLFLNDLSETMLSDTKHALGAMFSLGYNIQKKAD